MKNLVTKLSNAGWAAMASVSAFAMSAKSALAGPATLPDPGDYINLTPPDVGITTFDGNLIQSVIRWALFIAAFLALFFLIWGGIQWITSGGDKSANEAARNRITAALVGLAIVAAAYAIFSLVARALNLEAVLG